MANSEKTKKEIINLLKGSVIVDLHFGCGFSDLTIERITIEKDGALYLCTIEKDVDYGVPCAWLEVQDVKTLKRLY